MRQKFPTRQIFLRTVQQRGILMALIARDRSTDSQVREIASDLALSQQGTCFLPYQLHYTPEQVVDTYIKQFTASGGTYDMKGSTLTMKTTIAKNPNIMTRGDWISYTVAFNGQTMILTATATNQGPIKNPMVMTLTRIE